MLILSYNIKAVLILLRFGFSEKHENERNFFSGQNTGYFMKSKYEMLTNNFQNKDILIKYKRKKTNYYRFNS